MWGKLPSSLAPLEHKVIFSSSHHLSLSPETLNLHVWHWVHRMIKMSFTALPNELIYQISQRIQPEDIEQYANTNHRIRDIAMPFLLEHYSCRSKYTKISLNNITAASLFYELCARPWVGSYPRILEIRSNKDWQSFTNVQRRNTSQIDSLLRRRSVVSNESMRYLLRTTGLISESDMGQWIGKIELGDEDFLFAMMLACLPNLYRLIIRLDDTGVEQVKEMLRTIKRKPIDLHHHKALHRLIDVRVLEREGSSERSNRETSNLELFTLVAAVPGVKVLHARNLVGRYRDSYRDGWHTYPGASSSIEKIYLETCGMSTEGLEMLCKSIKGLRSFSYVAHR